MSRSRRYGRFTRTSEKFLDVITVEKELTPASARLDGPQPATLDVTPQGGTGAAGEGLKLPKGHVFLGPGR
ncbi:hypothetical protein AYO44_12080 [Planctomycetaceae bacterium SCGC AG-212-F19]|nr:hypothetical protein AYO44_12080 [Planctomycetaceae bacterium SCGC AG-212-F19]